MCFLFLIAAIEGGILMVAIKALQGDEIEMTSAFIVALVAAILTNILTYFLAAAIGMAGILVAAILVAAVLGVCLSALFGMEIKRAVAAAGIFVVAHFAISIGIGLALQR